MNMNELLLKLKEEYLADIPQKINEITELYEQKNMQELKNSFHKLKGSGKTYGVEAMTTLCKELERICAESPDKFTNEILNFTKEIMTEIANHKTENSEQLSKDARFQKIESIV